MSLAKRIKIYVRCFLLTKGIPWMASQQDLDAILAELNQLETLTVTTIPADTAAADAASTNVATVAATGVAAVAAAQATADANNKAAADTAAGTSAQLTTDQANAAALLQKIKSDVQALS